MNTQDIRELRDEVKRNLHVYRGWTTDEYAQKDVDNRVDAIVALINSQILQARIESLQWALNDYNMPDTNTAKNLEDFINDLTKQQEGR